MKNIYCAIALFVVCTLFNTDIFSQESDSNSFPKGQAVKVDTYVNFKEYEVKNILFEEDFESSGNWEIIGDWVFDQRSNISGKSALSNLGATYSNNSDQWLISPVISLQGILSESIIILEFQEWFEIESVYDKGFVKVSTDNGRTWLTIGSNDGFTKMRKRQIDLSRFANTEIKIAFNLVTDNGNTMRGWNIDDVKIFITSKPLVLNLSITSLNSQNFPFIYINATVDEDGVGINSLTQSNFSVFENNNLQTDLFYVTPPQSGGGVRLADIIFIMDNSGSMGDEQLAVRNNVIDFVNNLVSAGVDFNLGLCRYGQSANSGNPIIEDNGILTSNAEYFKNTVWSRNTIDGGYEPGYYAITESSSKFSFRPGSQKIFIIITDETPDQGVATQQDAITALVNNSITLFALTESTYNSYFTPLTQASNGAVFDIYSPFNQILNYIISQVANSYVISYRSSDPNFNGITRNVELRANYNGSQFSDFTSYIPGAAPTIVRTASTLSYHNQAWAQGTSFNIEVEITDNISPGVQTATLYYKNTATNSYSSLSMSNTGGKMYTATIPGSAVVTPGLDYYVTATDGISTSSAPSTNPSVFPYQIAILPNVAPSITHTPVTSLTIGNPIMINATVVDNTNSLAAVNLFYRKIGQLLYQEKIMTNPGGNNYTADIPAPFVTTDGIEYYIYAVDNFGVGNSIGTSDFPIKINNITTQQFFVIKDVNSNLIPHKEFEVIKVSSDFSETLIVKSSTNSDGKISVLSNWFNSGDQVKIQRKVHAKKTPFLRGGHSAVGDTMYTICIDNGNFTSLGEISFHTFSTDTDQEIILNHSTIKYNLVISIEWDSDDDYINNLGEAMRDCSNYLYDVTNGQMFFDKVVIYDDKKHWGSADMRIYSSNMEWPHAFVDGISFLGHIHMPRCFYYNHKDSNRNLTYSRYPYDWRVKNIWGKVYPGIRTIAHEFGHYGFGFYDEYLNLWGKYILDNYNFGFMDDQLKDETAASEMSSILQYPDKSYKITMQWSLKKMACWDDFANNYEDTHDGIPVKIKLPINQFFIGPNDDIDNPTYDVGRLFTDIKTFNPYSNAISPYLLHVEDDNGNMISKAEVYLLKRGNVFKAIFNGQTSDAGYLYILGPEIGDKLWIGARDSKNNLYYSNEIPIQSPMSKEKPYLLFAPKSVSNETNQVSVILRPINGFYSLTNTINISDDAIIKFNLFVNKEFPETPYMNLINKNEEVESYEFEPGQLSKEYSIYFNTDLPKEGYFYIVAYDDENTPFFINYKYTNSIISSLTEGPGGDLTLGIDVDKNSLDSVLIISSSFFTHLESLEYNVRRVGDVYSIASHRSINELNGENFLTIRYADSDLNNFEEESIRIFKWNEEERNWNRIGGEVNTELNSVTAQISTFGTYAAFTTKIGTTGDKLDDGDMYFYPNPLNPNKEIGKFIYGLKYAGNVYIKIYDVTNTLIREIQTQMLVPGSAYESYWDGKDVNGKIVSNGVFFYVIESSSGERAVGKIAILK